MLTVTDSSVPSPSSTAVSVTVCTEAQFVVVKVSDVGLAVTAPVSSLDTATVTSAFGAAFSFTV